MLARLFHFLKDRRGATGVEFALVFLVFFGAILNSSATGDRNQETLGLVMSLCCAGGPGAQRG